MNPTRCKRCGEFLLPWYKYCPSCAEKIIPETQVTQITCPHCNGTGKVSSLFD